MLMVPVLIVILAMPCLLPVFSRGQAEVCTTSLTDKRRSLEQIQLLHSYQVPTHQGALSLSLANYSEEPDWWIFFYIYEKKTLIFF